MISSALWVVGLICTIAQVCGNYRKYHIRSSTVTQFLDVNF